MADEIKGYEGEVLRRYHERLVDHKDAYVQSRDQDRLDGERLLLLVRQRARRILFWRIVLGLGILGAGVAVGIAVGGAAIYFWPAP